MCAWLFAQTNRKKKVLRSPKVYSPKEVKEIRAWLHEMTSRWGPVVESYPSWHPLVAAANLKRPDPMITPERNSRYGDIDHTVLFRNAFLSCPYSKGDNLLKSVREIQYPECVYVQAERVGLSLYQKNANPILVSCDWHWSSQPDGTISQRSAVALMIEEEMKAWNDAQVGETWNTMRPYLLGHPCGKRSSLFVNQKTGQAMRKVFETIMNAGVFGPIRVD